jgi:hypothetical protein
LPRDGHERRLLLGKQAKISERGDDMGDARVLRKWAVR